MLNPFSNFAKSKLFLFFRERKSLLFLLAIGLAIFIILIVVFFQIQKIKKAGPVTPSEEEIIDKQLKELDKLREEAGSQTPSPEEIEAQLKELEVFRKKTEAPSQQQIQQQIEELDKLRQSQ